MRSDSDLHEPRTNAEQSETGGDLRVSYESDDLYFIRVKDGPVKIGRSNNVRARLASMQTGCPFDLECILVMPGQGFQEKLWHEALDDDRCRGEWFDYNSSEVRNAIGLAKQGKDWWEAVWPFDYICDHIDPSIDLNDAEHEIEIMEAVTDYCLEMKVLTHAPPNPKVI